MKRNFNENSTRGSQIEQQLNSIFNGIVSNLPQDLVALRCKPLKNSSYCMGLIQIYLKDAIKKKSEDVPKHVEPLETYAFYIKDFKDARLESVAIYTAEASAKYFSLKRKGVLFGYRIQSIQIETGFRPFVDVKLSV